MASSRGEDIQKFLHFYVYCVCHNTKLQSLACTANFIKKTSKT